MALALLRPGRALLACLLLAALAASPTRAQKLEVESATLENGMKVLVHEDRSIPNVAMYLFYRIGSRNERPGTTGLSHFFEHMMYNGAKKYGRNAFDEVMEAAGGANNGFTTRDLTVYQNWFPRSAAELIFDLEADRIEHLAFVPEVVEAERGVVASERRTGVDANNFGILSEQLWATAFTAHPYKWPVVGWMSDIEGWEIADLKEHFSMGYSPSNATVVLAGALTPEEGFALARKHFEPIPSRRPPPPVRTREPEQMGERRVVVRKFAQLPLVMMAFHVPHAGHQDTVALQVLLRILFSGQSSRMYQRLVDQDQTALFVNGNASLAFDPTLFTLTSQPRQGIDPARVEQAIVEELERLHNEPVKEEELRKAKNILLAEFYRALKTIDGRARSLGNAEIYLGGYHALAGLPERYEKVTAEDIQRVARAYFTERNRTVATLIPEVQPEAKAQPEAKQEVQQ